MYYSFSWSLMHIIIWQFLAGGIQQTAYPYLNEQAEFAALTTG